MKPFLPRELVLRLMAILKRVYSSPVVERLSAFRLGEQIIDLDSAVVHRNHKELPLTAKEHAILVKLYETRIALSQVTPYVRPFGEMTATDTKIH